jgi:hypothetical protein
MPEMTLLRPTSTLPRRLLLAPAASMLAMRSFVFQLSRGNFDIFVVFVVDIVVAVISGIVIDAIVFRCPFDFDTFRFGASRLGVLE